MKKTFITFGQSHIHKINGKTFDKDCVAVIEHDENQSGRDLAFTYFGKDWCFEYPQGRWSESKMVYFPRGYLTVNGQLL